MAEYLFQGTLDNTVHDISYGQIKQLYEDNLREEAEGRRVTQSSYRGENYYTDKNLQAEFDIEVLYRDPLTAGMRVQYPHGVIIQQSQRRNFYRGENQQYEASVPSLLRTTFPLLQELSDVLICEFHRNYQLVQIFGYGIT